MTDQTPIELAKKPSSTPAQKKSSPTRQDQLRKLLRRKSGVTIAQIERIFGWQAHSARAAISRLRTGGEVVERTSSAKGPVYRITEADAAK